MDAYKRDWARADRREVIVTAYRCFGPDRAFDDGLDDEDLLNAIHLAGGLPCDAGGRPGPWCNHCSWGSVTVVDEYDE